MNESRVLFLGKANTAPPLVVVHFRLQRLVGHCCDMHLSFTISFPPCFTRFMLKCGARVQHVWVD